MNSLFERCHQSAGSRRPGHDRARQSPHDTCQILLDPAEEYLPGKPYREFCLPVWMVRPVAWVSTVLSTALNRETPLFDPSLYALDTIVHNLDFSNTRMLDWLKKSGLEEFYV